jgi:quercetin dioxygenase-like cupin family protein
MRKRWTAIAVALAAVAAGVVGAATHAWATAPSGFATENISTGSFPDIDIKTGDLKVKAKGPSDVYVVRNTVAPGGSSGWHTHPGPSLITVVEGEATFYDGDDPTCAPHKYTKGQGVIDPGDGHVHILRNEGTVPLVTVAVQILPGGTPRRIDMPNPGNCPF